MSVPLSCGRGKRAGYSADTRRRSSHLGREAGTRVVPRRAKDLASGSPHTFLVDFGMPGGRNGSGGRLRGLRVWRAAGLVYLFESWKSDDPSDALVQQRMADEFNILISLVGNIDEVTLVATETQGDSEYVQWSC